MKKSRSVILENIDRFEGKKEYMNMKTKKENSSIDFFKSMLQIKETKNSIKESMSEEHNFTEVKRKFNSEFEDLVTELNTFENQSKNEILDFSCGFACVILIVPTLTSFLAGGLLSFGILNIISFFFFFVLYDQVYCKIKSKSKYEIIYKKIIKKYNHYFNSNLSLIAVNQNYGTRNISDYSFIAVEKKKNKEKGIKAAYDFLIFEKGDLKFYSYDKYVSRSYENGIFTIEFNDDIKSLKNMVLL